MFDRLREFVNEKLGREDPQPPEMTTVPHGHVPEAELDRLRSQSTPSGFDVPETPGATRYLGTASTEGLHINGGPIAEGAVLRNRFHIPNPAATILGWCSRIKNDRDQVSILKHLRDDEMVELEDEVEAWGSLPAGSKNTDRVVAEAMDAVACLLDLIHYVKPDVTLEELDRISTTLCARWAIKYSGKAGKPEGTDARSQKAGSSSITDVRLITTEFIVDDQQRVDHLKEEMLKLGYWMYKTERRDLPEGYYWICFTGIPDSARSSR